MDTEASESRSEPVPAPPSEAEATLLDEQALTRIEAELADVARALERLDEGTYGTCVACGSALADTVLAADPTAQRCAEHPA